MYELLLLKLCNKPYIHCTYNNIDLYVVFLLLIVQCLVREWVTEAKLCWVQWMCLHSDPIVQTVKKSLQKARMMIMTLSLQIKLVLIDILLMKVSHHPMNLSLSATKIWLTMYICMIHMCHHFSQAENHTWSFWYL